MPLRYVTPLLNESHLVDLAQCRETDFDFTEAAFAKRDHAFVAGGALDFGSRPAVNNHFADAVGQVKQFANRRAAVIAGAGALKAARAFGKLHVAPFLGFESSFLQFFGRKALQLFAVVADDADEALRQDAI